MPVPNNPSLSAALARLFAGVSFNTPKAKHYRTADPDRVDAEFSLVAVQNEILDLNASRLSSQSYQHVFSGAPTAGQPCYLSANNTLSLALSTNTTKNKVI